MCRRCVFCVFCRNMFPILHEASLCECWKFDRTQTKLLAAHNWGSEIGLGVTMEVIACTLIDNVKHSCGFARCIHCLAIELGWGSSA